MLNSPKVDFQGEVRKKNPKNQNALENALMISIDFFNSIICYCLIFFEKLSQ